MLLFGNLLIVAVRSKLILITALDNAGSTTEKGASVSRINYIPRSRWPKGIPPVMGAHLMPSGEVAPISTSKGEHCFL